MLSVSGLQAAIKRRNSKVPKDSLSIRRFSSSEALSSHLQSPPSGTPSVATVARKSSFSRRIRKVSTGNSQVEAIDACTLLDLHIAQIKRKLADFREEDVDISERVEELTSSLSDLCQGYHIPVKSVEYNMSSIPADLFYHNYSEGDIDDDEEVHKLYINQPRYHHSFNLGSTASGHSRQVATDNSSARNKYPLRSLSHGNTAPLDYSAPSTNVHHLLAPRHSYPDHFSGHQERDGQYRRPYDSTSSYRPRPMSYQDIAYDENDYEESNPEDCCWSELSCP